MVQPITDAGRCQSVCPILPTSDVGRAVKFYESLGFQVAVYGDFVMTKRDGIELFLSLRPDHDPKRTASCLFVRVDDANVLHAHWQTNGVGDEIKPLRDTDYGMREFAVIDPDGNMMLFGSPHCTARPAQASR
jgi:predicted enzyme related to lactoylglutathione lyase